MSDMAETAPPQLAEGSTRDARSGSDPEVGSGSDAGSAVGAEAGYPIASGAGSTPGKAASLETVLSLRNATLGFADRTLWSGLDLDVHAGEFIAVLGANGSGKTSLLRVILGQQKLQAGSVEFLGEPVARGNRRIGYVPQQRLADEDTPLRARDLVGLGVDGHRWGVSWPSKRRRALIDGLLDAVGAASYAKVPIATLSGGEQQRLRVGQALAGDPRMLLCDEPLLSLDLAHQRAVSELIDRHRRERQLGVLFVTHDINPVLDLVDRVLYLAGGKFRVGTPDQVLRSEVLSELYGSPVDVIRTRGRIVVVGTADAPQAHPDGSHAHHDEQHDPSHDAEPITPFAFDGATTTGAAKRTWRKNPQQSTPDGSGTDAVGTGAGRTDERGVNTSGTDTVGTSPEGTVGR